MTAPNRKLDVQNIVGVEDTTGTEKIYLYAEGGGADVFFTGANGNVRFDTRSGGNSYINNGNVGIGTANPNSMLHISKALSATSTSAGNLLKLYGVNGADKIAGIGFNYAGAPAAEIAPVFVGVKGVLHSTYTTEDFFISTRGTETNTEPIERLYIQSTGNVGIGTTTPSQALDVQGNIRASGNIIAGGTMTANVSAPNVSAGTFGTTAGKGNYTFEAAANTNNVLKVDATNERVGIGTGSPGAALHVTGAVTSRYAQIASNGLFLINYGDNASDTKFITLANSWGNTANLHNILFKSGDGTTLYNSAQIQQGHEVNWTSTASTRDSYLSFFTSLDGTMGEKVRIDSAGNVGIGTTAPITKLQIDKRIQTAGDTVPSGALLITDTVGSNFGMEMGVSTANSYGWIQSRNIASNTNYNLALNPIQGNVGIGTTNPSALLTLGANANTLPTNTKLWIAGAGGTSNSVLQSRISLGFNNNMDYGGYIGNINVDSGVTHSILAFGTRRGGTDVDAMYLTNGSVGIGTSAPSSTLHVIGDIRASGNVIAGGTMTANVSAPNVSAGTFGTTAGKGNYTFEAAANTNNVLKVDATNERIGIGTASPGATLQIGDASSTVWINSNSTNGLAGTLVVKQKGNTVNDGILLTDSSGTQSQLAISNVTGTSTYVQIQAQYSSGYRDLILQPSGGNIGIGVTNPSAKLDVAGSINAQSLNASVITGANASFTGLLQTGSGGASDGLAVNGFTTITGQTSIGTNVITGTDATLDIRSLGDSARSVAKITSFNNVGGLLFNEYRDNGGSASTPLWVINSYANNPIAISPGLNSGGINSNSLVYFNTNGNVTMGGSGDTGYKLYVSGTGYFSNPVYVGSPTASGHAATKSYVDSMFSGATSIFSSTYAESFNLSKFAYLEKADELRWKTPVNTERWNGSAWETWSSPPNFAYATDGLGNTEVAVPNTTSQFRLTYQTDACLAPYALIQQDYMTDRFNLRIETSADQVSWTQHNYATALTGFQNVVNIGDDNCRGYYRFTFDVYYFYDATFRLVGLQLVSTRPASQGGMMETLLPITWDTSRNIGVVGNLTVSGSGNSSFAGNVGIGTTTPGSYKLYVAGGAKFDNPIEVGSPTAVNHATTKSYVDSLLGTGGSGTSTASFGTIYVAGTSTLAATGGRVTIGANLPAAPSKANIDGSLQVIGTMSATAFYDYDNTSYYINPNTANIGFKTLGSVQSDGAIDNNYFMANTLIGTATNPGTYKFAVSGTSHFSGTSEFDNQVTINANLNLGANNISMTGNIGNVAKLTVATIDPLYEIDGEKYATYASSIAGGVKEEYVGRGNLQPTTNNQQQGKRGEKISNSQCSIFNQVSNTNDPIDSSNHSLKTENCKISAQGGSASGRQNSKLNNYTYVIDFSKIEKGSDLWVWYQAVDFSKDNVEVMATAYGIPVAIAYEIKEKKIIFKAMTNDELRISNEGIEFSFRLVGKRFDHVKWPTYSKDQSEKPSFILKGK
ncbi:MAG: hypothetical protein WC842_04000 [Candidatus Paceibacterota bacterium]|jgi:hypothetical protein